LTKACLDARHDVRQMRLGDLIVRLSTFFVAPKKTASLHQTQVFGCHVARNLTRLGKFSHRVSVSQKHLHNPQAVSVRQDF
jgi:hypothetical protein